MNGAQETGQACVCTTCAWLKHPSDGNMLVQFLTSACLKHTSNGNSTTNVSGNQGPARAALLCEKCHRVQTRRDLPRKRIPHRRFWLQHHDQVLPKDRHARRWERCLTIRSRRRAHQWHQCSLQPPQTKRCMATKARCGHFGFRNGREVRMRYNEADANSDYRERRCGNRFVSKPGCHAMLPSSAGADLNRCVQGLPSWKCPRCTFGTLRCCWTRRQRHCGQTPEQQRWPSKHLTSRRPTLADRSTDHCQQM